MLFIIKLLLLYTTLITHLLDLINNVHLSRTIIIGNILVIANDDATITNDDATIANGDVVITNDYAIVTNDDAIINDLTCHYLISSLILTYCCLTCNYYRYK